MTGVTISFVSNNVINIANATGAPVAFDISKFATDGTLSSVATLTIPDVSDSNYDFDTNVGIYRVYNPTAAQGTTIIIAKKITDALEEDVKQILLSEDKDKFLPKGYDFVNLALLSIIFIGNSPHQNEDYSTAYDSNYRAVAEAILRCEYYLDRQNNTPQSSNKIWQ